jgi:hypothetical protein
MLNEIELFDEHFFLSTEEETHHSVEGSPAGNPYIFLEPVSFISMAEGLELILLFQCIQGTEINFGIW